MSDPRRIRTAYDRPRIGAQYDQDNERRNFTADGNVAPAGQVGVGAVRPHQSRDNVGATDPGAGSWERRFPNLPSGAPRPSAAALAAYARPTAAPMQGPTRSGATLDTAMPSPQARAAYMPPRGIPFMGNASVALPNGETHTQTATRGVVTEYDPRRDATRQGSTVTDIQDPTRTTRTVAIDPRYGGGMAVARTNGGARGELADQYAADAEAGTIAALEAAGARQDAMEVLNRASPAGLKAYANPHASAMTPERALSRPPKSHAELVENTISGNVTEDARIPETMDERKSRLGITPVSSTPMQDIVNSTIAQQSIPQTTWHAFEAARRKAAQLASY